MANTGGLTGPTAIVARTRSIRACVLFVAALAFSTDSRADPVAFSTSRNPFTPGVFNQGWWAEGDLGDFASDSNHNYLTGYARSEFRSFFTFDLSSLDLTDRTLAGAVFEVNGATFFADSAEETLGLFDVTTAANVVNHNEGFNSTVFADLGTGVSYGTFEIAKYPANSYLTFALNEAALQDIARNAGSFFTIGARSLSGTPIPFEDPNFRFDLLFAFSGEFPASLILDIQPASAPVPEPSTIILLGTGVAALMTRRRHRRR